ncbi:hypothetical protein ACFL6U_03750 [Planctomycetota bacterium]
MCKVIFDTNFWSYLAGNNKEKDFCDVEKELKLEVLLPPSILLEAQKTKDRQKRIKIIKAMNTPNRETTRTEADLEAGELVSEVRRLLPECRNKYGNTNRIKKLRRFWIKGIWKDAIGNTDFYHKRMLDQDKCGVDQVIKEQQKNKKLMHEAKWDVNKTRPSEIKAQFSDKDTFASRFAEKNKKYEPWRIVNLYYYKKHLDFVVLPKNEDQRTVADWCEPRINIKDFLGNEKRYVDFWLSGIQLENMQRNWLRWAVHALQPFRKITIGNAYDDQHSAYLVDAEYFFTSDRRYFECLQTIYKDNAVEIAKPILLKADINQALLQIRKQIISGSDHARLQKGCNA